MIISALALQGSNARTLERVDDRHRHSDGGVRFGRLIGLIGRIGDPSIAGLCESGWDLKTAPLRRCDMFRSCGLPAAPVAYLLLLRLGVHVNIGLLPPYSCSVICHSTLQQA